MTKISVSVDDGNPLDLKVAEILQKKKIEGIFYIPIRSHAKLLKKKEIRELSENFEIGSHGLRLLDLTSLPEKELEKEISEAKKKLEEMIGKKIYSLAPPFGKYNKKTLLLAKRVGFGDVRSARITCFKKVKRSNFLWHPNIHFYPHSFLTDVLHLIKNFDLPGLEKRLKLSSKNHLELIEEFKKTGSLHIWLHSWELEKYHLWEDFERAIG